MVYNPYDAILREINGVSKRLEKVLVNHTELMISPFVIKIRCPATILSLCVFCEKAAKGTIAIGIDTNNLCFITLALYLILRKFEHSKKLFYHIVSSTLYIFDSPSFFIG